MKLYQTQKNIPVRFLDFERLLIVEKGIQHAKFSLKGKKWVASTCRMPFFSQV